MNKAYKKAIFFLILVTGIVFCGSGCSSEQNRPTFQTVEIHGHIFNLELALDNETRLQGLSDRSEIDNDGGMLFVFPYPRKTYFVMRRCLVPIDIIFLDANGRIVQMHQMAVEPYDTKEHDLKKYPSVYPSQFVIELKGGILSELPLTNGELVALPLDKLKRLVR